MEKINNGRVSQSTSLEGKKYVVPSRKNYFVLGFGTVWLLGWSVGFIFGSTALFNEGFGQTFPSAFLGIWLVMWSIGGLVISSILLWGYFGKETLVMGRREVHFQRTVLGVGQKKVLGREGVKNFRYQPRETSNSLFRQDYSMYGMGEGPVKFDYGMKTYSFGLGLDEAEARWLVKELDT